ncbi:MAG: hypothetical protein LBL85_03220 [Methanocalculaceae archaeon]|jgi:hypothetical protein|nr:hypothetical protein [Methanocalculaceae archaeon]
MNKTQTARLSVSLISLLYFPPLIILSFMATNFQSNAIPALTCLTYAITLLLLLLPAAGCWMYREIRRLHKSFLLLSIIPIGLAALMLFFTPMFGSNPTALATVIGLYIIFLNPYLQLLYLPVWFVIPHTDRPWHIPRLLAVISPAGFILVSLLMILNNPFITGNPAAITLLFCISFAAGIPAGIILLIRGLTHPEIPSPSPSERTP